MDLSDKLVTTSGEKESHDFPFFSREASLQCGQNLHPLPWLNSIKQSTNFFEMAQTLSYEAKQNFQIFSYDSSTTFHPRHSVRVSGYGVASRLVFS